MEIHAAVVDQLFGLAYADALSEVAAGVDFLIRQHFAERVRGQILSAIVLSVVDQHGKEAGEIDRADQQTALPQMEGVPRLAFLLGAAEIFVAAIELASRVAVGNQRGIREIFRVV